MTSPKSLKQNAENSRSDPGLCRRWAVGIGATMCCHSRPKLVGKQGSVGKGCCPSVSRDTAQTNRCQGLHLPTCLLSLTPEAKIWQSDPNLMPRTQEEWADETSKGYHPKQRGAVRRGRSNRPGWRVTRAESLGAQQWAKPEKTSMVGWSCTPKQNFPPLARHHSRSADP